MQSFNTFIISVAILLILILLIYNIILYILKKITLEELKSNLLICIALIALGVFIFTSAYNCSSSQDIGKTIDQFNNTNTNNLNDLVKPAG